MSSQRPVGVDSQLAILTANGSNLNGYSSDAVKLAAVGISLIREMFPSQQIESDEAAKLRLELMAEIAEEVGEQRFVRAVRDAIKVSHRRWDCSVARVREMAGLRYVPEPSPAALAWDHLTQIFKDHCRSDPEGRWRLEDKVVNQDGVRVATPAPKLSQAMRNAVDALGGWTGLAEAFPLYWGQKYSQFKELYHEDESSLRIDRPGSELERVG